MLCVHQTLHGYRGGHRLLAASLRLPPEADRTLLILSDRAGPRILPAFNGYLTAYPVPELAMFALARTYDAPEMDRPGCVYTHTLLVDWTDLAHLPDLRGLAKLHQRPQSSDAVGGYRSPMEIPAPVPDERVEGLTVGAWGRSLLHALYGNPEQPPVLVPAERGADLENLFLAIWSQQWPALRRDFSFSTGTMSLRGVLRGTLDLHGIPRQWAERLHRELPEATLLGADEQDQRLPAWVQDAMADLSSTMRTPLRAFMLEHGADISDGRSAFAVLVDAHRVLSAQPPIRGRAPLLASLAERYPNPDAAARLKGALVGPTDLEGEEQSVLRLLATSAGCSAFVVTDLTTRVHRLWATDRSGALRLVCDLLAQKRTELGECMLAELLNQVQPEDLAEIEQLAPGHLLQVISARPGLSASPRAWKQSPLAQKQILDAIIARTDWPQAELSSVVDTIITVGDGALAEPVFRRFGLSAIATVMAWMERERSAAPGPWLQMLRSDSAMLVTWLSSHEHLQPRTGAFLAGVLDPTQPAVRGLSAQLWLGALKQASNSIGGSEMARLATFVLALALQDASPAGARLAARSFQTVYEAIPSADFPEAAWKQLVPHLPRLGFLDEMSWNRREKLCRGLLHAFVLYDWSATAFLEAVQSKQALLDVIEYAVKADGGKGWLRRLGKAVRDNQLEASPEQRSVLEKWL